MRSSAWSERCATALARLGVPLVSHAGHEAAVSIGGPQAYGNPLRLRRALDHGERVVVAHCASLGTDRDLDRGPDGPFVPSFELFARMMREPRDAGRLFGDISAMTQRNRVGAPLRAVIERSDWHERLLHGSDYPLPGIMPLVSLYELASQGFITDRVGAVLERVREHNPLLFDLSFKRHLRSNGKRLPAAAFETRAFFAPGAG
jgi:mannonate dehydratase